ncbi:MAG: hypothetical protein SPI53_05655 [Erysipelotrichaceae bacterium]|nr:hypothetical protein [Erysipelotrichaceae bacterium]
MENVKKKWLFKYRAILLDLVVCLVSSLVSNNEATKIIYKLSNSSLMLFLAIIHSLAYCLFFMDNNYYYFLMKEAVVVRIGKNKFNKLLILKSIKLTVLLLVFQLLINILCFGDLLIAETLIIVFLSLPLFMISIIIKKNFNIEENHIIIVLLILMTIGKGLIK